MSGKTDDESKSLRDELAAAFDEAEETSVIEEEQAPDIEEPSTEAPAETAGEEAEDAIDPPTFWNKEEKAVFSTLPRAVQEVVSRRERERDLGVDRKISEANLLKQKLSALDDVIAPHRQNWALNGIDEVQAIRQLIAAQEFLTKDPVAGLAHIAKSYGLSLADLAQVGKQTNNVDPHVAAVAQQVAALTNELKRRDEAQSAQVLNDIDSTIQKFAEAKDEAGGLAHPHFEAVADKIAVLVGQIRRQRPELSHAEVLKQSYDEAVWANPETRAKLLQETTQRESAQRIAQEKGRTAKAKRAASSVSGAPGDTDSAGERLPDSLRGMLEAQFANYGG
jgi:hypothetical protein